MHCSALALSTPPPSLSSTTKTPPNVFPSSTRQALLKTQKVRSSSWFVFDRGLVESSWPPGVYTADRPYGVTNFFLRQQRNVDDYSAIGQRSSLVLDTECATHSMGLSVVECMEGRNDKLFQPLYVTFMTQNQERFRRGRMGH